MRHSVSGRTLAALVFLAILILPSISTAQPRQARERRAVAKQTAEAGLLAHLWSGWTHLWGRTGSILDPNGGKPGGTSGGGGASTTGDTGSGLDPNGK